MSTFFIQTQKKTNRNKQFAHLTSINIDKHLFYKYTICRTNKGVLMLVLYYCCFVLFLSALTWTPPAIFYSSQFTSNNNINETHLIKDLFVCHDVIIIKIIIHTLNQIDSKCSKSGYIYKETEAIFFLINLFFFSFQVVLLLNLVLIKKHKQLLQVCTVVKLCR